MKILFWVSVTVILYVYGVYPLVIYIWGTFFRKFAAKSYDTPPLSVVLAVRDEQERIAARIENLLDQEYPAGLIEVVVVSDGSVDGTAEAARNLEDERVKVIELDRPGGKAAAINAGVEAASHEIIVFADARQDFSRNAYAELVSMFHDEKVGAVSGELVFVEGEGGEMQEGVGLYWNYEKLIRRKESAADSVVGASGSIYAIRKSLFSPLPPHTILDDFLLPMRIVLKGYRVLFIRSAKAFDRVSPSASQEFRRKVRTLAGNFQALKLEPALLDPRRNRLFFQLVSHKLGRLFVPYFCMAALVSDFMIAGGFYRSLLILQLLFYASALLKFTPLARMPAGGIFRVAWTFIVLNAAAVGGLIVFAARRERAVWK